VAGVAEAEGAEGAEAEAVAGEEGTIRMSHLINPNLRVFKMLGRTTARFAIRRVIGKRIAMRTRGRKILYLKKTDKNANTAGKVEEYDEGLLSCVAFHPTDPTDPTATALLSTGSNQWIIDLGALVNYTGELTDLTGFTLWPTPKPIRIADGSY
jgi:hypothetical protein